MKSSRYREDAVEVLAETLDGSPQVSVSVDPSPRPKKTCAPLILGALAQGEQPASFLLPTRQAGLFRWCLEEGLRVVKPMTYMTIGEYREPVGCWIPSVLY